MQNDCYRQGKKVGVSKTIYQGFVPRILMTFESTLHMPRGRAQVHNIAQIIQFSSSVIFVIRLNNHVRSTPNDLIKIVRNAYIRLESKKNWYQDKNMYLPYGKGFTSLILDIRDYCCESKHSRDIAMVLGQQSSSQKFNFYDHSAGYYISSCTTQHRPLSFNPSAPHNMQYRKRRLRELIKFQDDQFFTPNRVF